MVAGTPGLFRTNLVSTSTPSLSPSTNAPVVAASHNGESECWEQATDGKAASNHFAGRLVQALCKAPFDLSPSAAAT
ncbi:hypothetical protein VDGE_30671 [Verticillium dahliae]|uniref:Uncharacterized protein n=1 Tax=Verticillium dahliae TaxID=27337 RepID=A0A444RSE8_VERDA|nr:hypothetical protein VDGE_30671 [Verticillium dahliae]